MSESPPLVVYELLTWSTSAFENASIVDSRLEAEVILSHVLDVKRIELYLDYDRLLSRYEFHEFKKLFNRRLKREPVAYIVGFREFWSLDFEVNHSVMIPRQDTECLVRSVIPFLNDRTSFLPKKILDIGTGSGAVVVALANETFDHQFYALDNSYDAVCMAKKNASRNGVSDKIVFFLSCWTDALKLGVTSFDLIVSNPPYIKSDDIRYLQPEVVLHEPIAALDGGQDGLDCLKKVIKESLPYLSSDGLLALEIGYDQGKEVKRIIDSYSNHLNIEIIKDYGGFDRVVHVRKN